MKTRIRLQISYPLNHRFNLPIDGLIKKYKQVEKYFDNNEKKILNGLQKITGLSFSKNIMDIYLIDSTSTASTSKPTIVGTKGTPQKIVRVIIHELIHNLLWDNNERKNWENKIIKLYPKENKSTAIHIAVHTILEAIYIEVLKKPKEIEKDIEECQNWPSYKRAWEIVKKEGYKDIIKKLKK